MRTRIRLSVFALGAAIALLVFGGIGPAIAAPAPTAPIPITSHRVTGDDYPLASILLREEGAANLLYQVRENGTVGEVEIVNSSGAPRLDEAAALLVKRWRFKPATENGTPVPATINTRVAFVLPFPKQQAAQYLTPTPAITAEPAQPAGNVFNRAFRVTGYHPDPADYPLASVAARETGTATLSFLVQENGTIDDIQLVASSGFARLDEAAKLLVRSKWRFRAGMQDGKPVLSRLTTQIGFFIEPCRLRLSQLPTNRASNANTTPPVLAAEFGSENECGGYPMPTRVDETDMAFVIAKIAPPDTRTLVLDLQVAPNAAVSDVRIAQSSGNPAIDDLAMRMAARLPFKPGRASGAAVASQARIEMRLSPGP